MQSMLEMLLNAKCKQKLNRKMCERGQELLSCIFSLKNQQVAATSSALENAKANYKDSHHNMQNNNNT